MHSGLWKCADPTLCSAGRRSWQGTTRPAAADLEASPHRSARLFLDPKGCGAVKQERSDVSALLRADEILHAQVTLRARCPTHRRDPVRQDAAASHPMSCPAQRLKRNKFHLPSRSSDSSVSPFAAHAACRRYTCGCPTRACTFVLALRAGMARSTNSQVTKPYPHPCSGVILGVKCELPCSRHTF